MTSRPPSPASPDRADLDAPTIQPDECAEEKTYHLKEFGDYEILSEIARGGCGVVYRARQRSLDRIVALKLLLSGRHASDGELKRFRTEAESAAKLAHPSIVQIYEVGEVDEQPFFSMQFISGQSLANRIKEAPIAPEYAARLVWQISEAVHYAHEQDVIHRDLKPANILLDTNGKAYVTDFGIAKRVHSHDSVTGVGDVLGTPSYMPPEQAGGKSERINALSDVYSLGAVLYATSTGRPPFQASTPLDTILLVLEGTPVAPRQLNRRIDRDLDTIIMKCLQKDPAKRYQSARALAEDLERFLVGDPILARPKGRSELALDWCRTHLFVSSVSGLGALGLLAVAIVVTLLYINEVRQREQLELKVELLEGELGETQNMLNAERARSGGGADGPDDVDTPD